MANDITQSPYIIDTAAASVIVGTSLRIVHIRWVGGTTAGHTAIIQDGAGREVWKSVATAANFVDDSYVECIRINGLIVPTLASGTLYITVA